MILRYEDDGCQFAEEAVTGCVLSTRSHIYKNPTSARKAESDQTTQRSGEKIKKPPLKGLFSQEREFTLMYPNFS